MRRFVPLAFTLALAIALVPAQVFAGCHALIVSNVTPTDPNGGSGTVQITPNTASTPAPMRRESTLERASDVLIYDDTAVAGGNCFSTANHIVLTYSVPMTYPASITSATTANFDVFDSAGGAGLSITARSSAGFASGGVAQTLISVDVVSPGTAATGVGGITQNAVGSAVRVKNLRLDPTSLAQLANATVTVSATAAMPSAVTLPVGVAMNTLAPGAGVIQQGQGDQSSGGTLTTPAIFDFTENFIRALLPASTNLSGVAGDVPTTATKIKFDLGTTLPYGVSVNFPATMQVGGATGLTLNLTQGGSCLGPANCVAVYNTTTSGPVAYDVNMTTAAAPNSGTDGNAIKIGVLIANPSGYGTVVVQMSMIPATIASLAGNANPNGTLVLSVPLMGSNTGMVTAAPSLTSLAPNAAIAGTNSLTVTVNGSNFGSNSVVNWNGSPRATTYVSATQLTATISASDLASVGNATVSVVNSASAISNNANFAITTPSAAGSLRYVIPHIISGNGYGTKVTVVNTSATANTITLTTMAQDGSQLSTEAHTLAPGATFRMPVTDADRYGKSLTKWAVITAQSAVMTNAWYDYIATQGTTTVSNSVSFSDSTPATDLSIPVEFEPGVSGVSAGKTVGLAIANPNANAATATLQLLDSNANVLATATLLLPANGQTAVDLGTIAALKSVLPQGSFVGSVTVSATAPVSAIAVEDSNGLFSAVPVGVGRGK